MNTSENENKESSVFEISEARLEELRARALEKAVTSKHSWVQRGPFIECNSCEFPHAVHIGTRKLLVDVKNGEPVLKDI